MVFARRNSLARTKPPRISRKEYISFCKQDIFNASRGEYFHRWSHLIYIFTSYIAAITHNTTHNYKETLDTYILGSRSYVYVEKCLRSSWVVCGWLYLTMIAFRDWKVAFKLLSDSIWYNHFVFDRKLFLITFNRVSLQSYLVGLIEKKRVRYEISFLN